jgi:hypothetical protein
MVLLSLVGAEAGVLINVDKSSQRMTVSVDGVQRYRWSISTGRANFSTPNGTYAPQRLARTWFSRKYYNSPMPYSIFFHRGYAIHGSYDIARLGGPASHGCVRLHPRDAATLFALVRSAGPAATAIVVTGETMTARRTRPTHLRAAETRTKTRAATRVAPSVRYNSGANNSHAPAVDRRHRTPAAGRGWADWGARSY